MKKKSPVKKLKIEQTTVDAFSRKLREWSKTLPKEEGNLVRLLVDRATAVNVGDLGGYNLRTKIRPEAEKLFKSLRRATQSLPAVSGVNLDPGDVWVRADWTAFWMKSKGGDSPSVIVDPGAARAKGDGSQ